MLSWTNCKIHLCYDRGDLMAKWVVWWQVLTREIKTRKSSTHQFNHLLLYSLSVGWKLNTIELANVITFHMNNLVATPTQAQYSLHNILVFDQALQSLSEISHPVSSFSRNSLQSPFNPMFGLAIWLADCTAQSLACCWSGIMSSSHSQRAMPLNCHYTMLLS